MTGPITNKLTAEELAELAELEKEDADRKASDEAAAKRQHLEALRLSKKLGATRGKPGLDFMVLETKIGNIAIRRPVDVEIDTIDDGADREAIENLAASIVIEPSSEAVKALMGEHHGLGGAIVTASMQMLRVLREEEAKK